MEGRATNRVGSSDLLSLWGRAYAYDAGGNRTRLDRFNGSTTVTTTYDYNDGDQLVERTVGSAEAETYAYDDNGNLQYYYDDPNLNPAVYEHSRENRLASWTESEAAMVGDGQKTAEYVYDAFGRLLWRKGLDGTESRHYYDGINELLVREKPQAGSWRTRYVNALAQSDIGQVLARRTATGWTGGGVPSTWTDRYYHYDTLGNAVMETDHHGEVVAFVDMEAFGNVVAGGTGGPRLTTKWSDPDTGLYYFNARWYDAGRGLFIERDIVDVADLGAWYRTTFQGPTYSVDHNGQCAVVVPVLKVVGILAGGAGVVYGGWRYRLRYPPRTWRNYQPNIPITCVDVAATYCAAHGTPDDDSCLLGAALRCQEASLAECPPAKGGVSRSTGTDLGPAGRARQARRMGVEHPERLFDPPKLWDLPSQVPTQGDPFPVY